MKLAGMLYARFEVSDLARTEAFAQDFGLITVERTDKRLVMRTRGSDLFYMSRIWPKRRSFTGSG